MFAIAFDMDINALSKNYGEPYNNAYYEIKKVRKSTTTTRARTKKISLIFQKKKHQKKTNKRKVRKKVFFRFLSTMMFGWVQ